MRIRLFAVLLVVSGAVSVAQVPGRGVPDRSRDSLQARVRARMSEVVRRQLALSDEQARRLAAANQRFERRRRALLNQEREARASLRVQLDRGDSSNAPQVSLLLDRMLQVQRSRFELMEEEQRELATFLTPVQRARYLGLQEQLRQRIEGMQPPPGPGRPPFIGRDPARGRNPSAPRPPR